MTKGLAPRQGVDVRYLECARAIERAYVRVPPGGLPQLAGLSAHSASRDDVGSSPPARGGPRTQFAVAASVEERPELSAAERVREAVRIALRLVGPSDSARELVPVEEEVQRESAGG